MRALIINMATSTDRMALQEEQLAHFDLPWERIDAVTPDTIDPPADDPVWHRWQRPLRETEMALLASHTVTWRRVIELDEPCLVLEDDALLAAETRALLEGVVATAGIDHLSLETRSRKKLVGSLDPRAPIRRLWQDRTGSAAYIVWPDGARKLLAHAERTGGPCDAIISSTRTLRSFQADPAMAIQIDQCVAYGLRPPFEPASTIEAQSKPSSRAAYSWLARAAFRWRRIWAQIGFGGRRVAKIGVADRRHILPAADFPVLK